MAAKFKVLSALIDADAELHGDPNGYHHVLVDVIEEIARPHGSESELSEAIYELVAQSFICAAHEGLDSREAQEDPSGTVRP